MRCLRVLSAWICTRMTPCSDGSTTICESFIFPLLTLSQILNKSPRKSLKTLGNIFFCVQICVSEAL
jgi:hypothetical protein